MMEKTFITITSLEYDAIIYFSSDSITDILGYHPQEVQGKSNFDFFHPKDVPFSRSVHNRSVFLDKAAVLHYARMRASNGRWVSCECCLTVVHNVIVSCTSIYRRGERSERRAIDAPKVQDIFSLKSKDQRYHMLEYLASRFDMPPKQGEPRAALILNRFTRSSDIMYATDAAAAVLGLSPEQLKNRSFYDCIQESCVEQAVECLESAKTNDSIAYMRFWFRDPRGLDELEPDEDEQMSDEETAPSEDPVIKEEVKGEKMEDPAGPRPSEVPPAPDRHIKLEGAESSRNMASAGRQAIGPLELEAVISCASDGLVVVVRQIGSPTGSHQAAPSLASESTFAAPWVLQAPRITDSAAVGFRTDEAGTGEMLMGSIRDVAVFAWALVGINESMTAHSSGQPMDEAQPHGGFLGQGAEAAS